MAAASRYIIELRQPGTVPTALLSAINAAGGTVSQFHNGVGMVIARHLSPAAATAIARRPEVQAVIPDRSIRWLPERRLAPAGSELVQRAPAAFARAAVGARGDPRTAAFFAHQWNMKVIHADSAWQITTRGAGVRVFILDTGADTAHQDLSGRFDGSRSTSFVLANPADTTDTTTSPFYVDSAGHGTIVSSIISSNGIGVASVAPQATLVMVKVLDARGQGSFGGVLSALLFAADTGANVINLSLGAEQPANDAGVLAFVDFLQRVVDYVARKGVVIVVAAGNDAVNTNDGIGSVGNVTDSINAPAALHHVVSVGATAPLDQMNFDRIASYSNFGRTGVAVFAPGGDFADPNRADTATSKFDLVLGACSNLTIDISCPAQNFYVLGAGTSFAAPHVTGEIAVIKSQAAFQIQGNLLATCMLATADGMNGNRIDLIYGLGRINVLHGATACHNGWSYVP